MIRNWLLVSMVAIFLGACGSGEKKEEATTTPTAESAGDNISAKEMTFDIAGSDSGKIDGLKSVNFEYDKSSLTTVSRKILGENAEWIRSHGTVSLQIEGHCDQRGSTEYNLSLGERRAKTVKEYLVGLGIPSNKLSIISYGEEKPLDPGDSESALARNRRANFVPLSQ